MINIKNAEERKQKILQKISTCKYSWRAPYDIIAYAKLDDALLCFVDDEVKKKIFSYYYYHQPDNKPERRAFFWVMLMEKFPSILPIIESLDNEEYNYAILSSGLSVDPKLLAEKLVKSKVGVVRLAALDYLDNEQVSKLIDDDEPSVRLTAYKRLGPYQYLDKILEDKAAMVRVLGVKLAPKDYPKLSDMIKERSSRIMRIIISKVKKEDLPYFLGNSIVKKDSRTKEIIEQRMTSGEENE